MTVLDSTPRGETPRTAADTAARSTRGHVPTSATGRTARRRGGRRPVAPTSTVAVAVPVTRPVPTRSRRTAAESRRRPDDRRMTSTRGGTACRGSRRITSAVRVSWAAAFAVGVVLALTVVMFALLGGAVQDSAAPASTATQVVHVRVGESLSEVAMRTAPDRAPQAVVNAIIALNHLADTGVTPGQALLTPVYATP
ncbi:hypothetical protein SAMN05445060_1215 [Williamsia sterculiae]|uniref:LysM domain-containing protein n=1 Tax=Williamsia sterculiae TaxID=1344003 RepID=A0A1N7EET1_9NOCA|nr:hypothetical protein SAMN05445060_1215 [Williamsia sterculiae]